MSLLARQPGAALVVVVAVVVAAVVVVVVAVVLLLFQIIMVNYLCYIFLYNIDHFITLNHIYHCTNNWLQRTIYIYNVYYL